LEAGPLEFHDKMELKRGYAKLGVRVVPHAVARYGAYLAPGTILMPSYVNIGAYVDEGTMVDTWATVGSCAQIGKHVHLSGGVGIGGVLEPVQAAPVIIEDGCLHRLARHCGGRRARGPRSRAGCQRGAHGQHTHHRRHRPGAKEMKGFVPPRSVVIPGTTTKKFPAGEFGVPCALIIGQRKDSTDKKTSLNDALREHSVAV
jgi:2,3,4,5-tetrahydropyridine-2-carboxylate N-succinyltransferase